MGALSRADQCIQVKMKRTFIYLLFLFLLLDAGYSFIQHYNQPLDGDLSAIVLPSEGYSHVLEDPFGFRLHGSGRTYAAPNRYFAHITMGAWFKSVPFIIQQFTDPVNSIYIASGMAKTLIQLSLILALAAYISGVSAIGRKNYLVSAALVTPLFQVSGYYGQMGIIDNAVTYAFFYALPLFFLLLFFLPFYYLTIGKIGRIKSIWLVLLGPLMVYLTFNGPLVPGIVMIACPLWLFFLWWKNFRSSDIRSLTAKSMAAIRMIPAPFLYFIVFCVFSLYSLYLGTFNNENTHASVSLLERFALIPAGLKELLTQKPGLPLLLAMTIFNLVLVWRRKELKAKQIMNISRWILFFSLLYILLLPFGGYREYRPTILRNDTFLPVTLGLIITFGISTVYLLSNNDRFHRKIYGGAILLFSLFFTIADEPIMGRNDCEKRALNTISGSKEQVVALQSDCFVMSWNLYPEPAESEINARMLHTWNVTEEVRLYYHKNAVRRNN